MMMMMMMLMMMMVMMMMMMIWPRSKLSRKRAFQNEYFHAFQNDTFPLGVSTTGKRGSQDQTPGG